MRICLVINGFHNGGIEKVLENYFSHMNREGLDLHIISHLEPNEEIEKRFRELGFTIHHFSYYHARSIKPKNMKEYDEFFKTHKFDIVHNNVAINILPLLYAKKYGVPVRILHSHTDYTAAFANKSPLTRIVYNYVIKKNVNMATHYFACGKQAGLSIYGKKLMHRVTVINNAFDTSKFIYQETYRREIRQKLKLADKTVIGHVGRFEDEAKNQSYLVDVFAEYLHFNHNAILLLVGDGRLRKAIEDKCRDMGINDKVIFTGAIKNVNEYLSAMDIFVFPSKFEGLSVATLEAQCADLPGIIADGLSPEMNVLNEFKVIPLSDGATTWAKSLIGINKTVRKDRSMDLANAGYEITIEANKLRNMYNEYLRKD